MTSYSPSFKSISWLSPITNSVIVKGLMRDYGYHMEKKEVSYEKREKEGYYSSGFY